MKNRNHTSKMIAQFLIFALLLALNACGSKPEAADPTPVGLPNPVKSVTAEEMVQAVGVPLYAPENAENIRHSTITSSDTVIGQMMFTLDGKEYTYRTAAVEMDAVQLSGMFYSDFTESYAQVSYAEGKILTSGSTSVLFWEDKVPGVCYSLSCSECENPAVLLEIAEETFHPLQGEVSGDDDSELPNESPDLEGTWVDADGSTVEITPVGMQKYEAVVGIFRLAEFTGTAELDAASMNLTLEAPDGSTVNAEFILEEDGTARLNITKSDWSLLESGTQFAGFSRQESK